MTVELIEIPGEYLVDQGDLQTISDKANLEEVAKVQNKNYSKYHQLRAQVLSIKEYQDKVKEDVSKKNKN